MILVQVKGGLGSQMFQYALGRALSIELKTPLLLDTSSFDDNSLYDFDLNKLNTKFELADSKIVKQTRDGKFRKMISIMIPGLSKMYKEKQFHYDPMVLSIKDGSYIVGDWKSYRYFEKIRPVLLEDFSPKYGLSPKAMEISDKIKNCESVSFHIRRGEYVTNPEAHHYHGVMPLDYFITGLGQIKANLKKPEIFVFSDDPNWAKGHLKLQYPIHIVSDYYLKNFEEMKLMSQCKVNIIANSSFSWWAAYLNQNPDKKVIAPVNWFRNSNNDTSDLIPKGWIRI
jgi:hypothetical protein